MTQICILDSQGRRICYENQAAAIVYYEHSRHQGTVVNPQPGTGTTDLEKLRILVDWVATHHPYDEYFRDPRVITFISVAVPAPAPSAKPVQQPAQTRGGR